MTSAPTDCVPAPIATPDWFARLLGIAWPAENGDVGIAGKRYVRREGILRAAELLSDAQAQSGAMFGFKWQKRETFDSPASLARMRAWLIERYGDVAAAPWWDAYGPEPLVVDAGCGAAMSALELLAGRLSRVRYLGVDVSAAVDVAARRFEERGQPGVFLQADLGALPLAAETVDVIFSEGVLHHTDSTERALLTLARLLKPGGRFLFYVYRKKGPIREFTDDYVRERLRAMPPEAAWEAMLPLTRLGIALGKLDIEVEVPEEIALLDIPAGKMPLQRLFYWHVFKAFYHPDLTVEETNHINFDWYAPANAHRQTPEEVRSWCAAANLVIEREVVEPAGITIVARKREAA